MKETLHLGRHSKEQHEGQAPPKHTTTAQPPPVHTTQSEGDVHVMRQHMIGGGTASATGAGIGTQDAAGCVLPCIACIFQRSSQLSLWLNMHALDALHACMQAQAC